MQTLGVEQDFMKSTWTEKKMCVFFALEVKFYCMLLKDKYI